MEQFTKACSFGLPQPMGQVYGYPYYGAYIEGVETVYDGCVAISPIWRIKYNAMSSSGRNICCTEYVQLYELPHLFITPTNLNFEAIVQFLRQGLTYNQVDL